VVRTYAGLVAFVLALLLAAPAAALADHDVRLSPAGNLTSSGHLAEWLANPPGWLIVPVIAAIVIIGLSFVGHQVLSWRRAEGDRRQQLKWLACGGAVAAASLLLAAVLGVAGLLAGLAALPVSIGVGILRYRLYDIDRIISRTLAYALVTGMLIGVYAGLVLLATRVLSVHTPVAVAAATLAAAALFTPLRRRVQQAVDRRFNRARYDADQTVAAFAGQRRIRAPPSDPVRAANILAYGPMVFPLAIQGSRSCRRPAGLGRTAGAVGLTKWGDDGDLRPLPIGASGSGEPPTGPKACK
jgi:hypothetical protein